MPDVFGRRDPEVVLAFLVAFVVAITIHEYMHAYTAWRLGDDTARQLGRITLNPAMHFEPIGFIGMLLIAFGYPAFGWGKPVPVNPNRLRSGLRGRQGGMALVAFAGPLSNVVQAAAVAIPLRLSDRSVADFGRAGLFMEVFVFVNLLLASFNMIPIPPLDGHKILTGLLPNFWYPILAPLERYGFAILLLIFFVGGRLGSSVTGEMISPVYELLARIVVGDPLLF